MIRRLLKNYPAKVDFLIIGVQKGGTSALHHYLKLHPQLVPPEQTKELQFFLGDDKRVEWYHRQFPVMRYGNRLCYESTPDYICGYHFLEKIARYKFRYSPRMKLIVLFRNPVERAYSQWNMTRTFIAAVNDPTNANGLELKRFNPGAFELYRTMDGLPSFEQCFDAFIDVFDRLTPVDDLRQLNRCRQINEIPSQFFTRGLYIFQLNALRELFPREDILLLESTELRNHTMATLERTTNFLNISPFAWPESKIRVRHLVSDYRHPLDVKTAKQIGSFYLPYNDALSAVAEINNDGWNSF